MLCAALSVGVQPAPAQTPTLDSEELSFLTLLNNYRAQNGAGPLQVSIALENSSTWMSTDMANKNYFSHTDSLGRDPFTRMAAFGYSYNSSWGENIAAGYSDAQSTFNQWVTACDPDSNGTCTYAHKLNMLNPSYVVIGIGRANNNSSTYRWYWTTDFGGVLDKTIGTGGGGSAPTINSFSASPSTITAGQSSILTWSISGATTVSIDNNVGDVSTVTSKSVSPAQTTSYTITASNSTGSSIAHATVTVNPAPDTQPPTAPSITSAVAKSQSEVDLAWSASTDNVGVSGYQIYRNGSTLATVPATARSFADTQVSPNTTYTYSLKAYDAAGNYSNASNSAQVTTPPSGVSQTLSIASGSPQSATVSTQFPAPLQAKVVDSLGNPVSNVTVTFTTPVSGATATFAGGNVATASTNSSGIATSPALTANATSGTFSATASAAGMSVNFSLTNLAVSTPPPASSVTIWADTTIPAIRAINDGNPIELGVKFRSDVSGKVTGVRFYRGSGNGGTHTGSLWTSSGALLATGTYTNESPSGWQTLTFSSPVAIAANTTYVASYHTSTGVYALDFSYFASKGSDNAPLHALQYGVDGPNGVYVYGPGGVFPSTNANGNNYWVDVVFSSAGGGSTPPPPVATSIAAVAGSGQSANTGAGFPTALQAKVLDNASNPMSGITVTFTAPSSGASATFSGGGTTATAVTNSQGIATSPTLTANGSAGAFTITASTASLAPASFTLTNTAIAPPPPTGATSTIWPNTATPAFRAINDGNPVELGVRFRSDVAGQITGVRFYKGSSTEGTHTGSLWTSTGALLASGTFTNETASGWQTLTFAKPVTILANTTYVASYHTSTGVYALSFSYFSSQGFDNPPLHALQYGVDGPNGVYAYGPGGIFPSNSGNGNNYWVDVVLVH